MKIPFNIPNVLSAYRLLMCPVIIWIIVQGYETVFVVLFAINLLTDILDGYIARHYNMQTEQGALLDSWADVGSYIIAFAGVYKFHSYIYQDYPIFIIIYIGLYIAQMIISKIKYGQWVAGWHSYAIKINGYFQGFFFVILFSYGFIKWLFVSVLLTGCLSELELIILNFLCPKPIQNVKGLYWLVKHNSNKTKHE